MPYRNEANTENSTSTSAVVDSMIALNPTEICVRKPAAPPSVTSVARLRADTREMQNAENRKVRPFTKNVTSGGPRASNTAPTAGPTMIDPLATMLLRALAAARSFSPTSCGVIAASAG